MKTMGTEACEGNPLSASRHMRNATSSATKRNLTTDDIHDEMAALSAIYGMDCSEEDYTESNAETYFESLAPTERGYSHPEGVNKKIVRSPTDVVNEALSHRPKPSRTTQKKDGRSLRHKKGTNSYNSGTKKEEASQSVLSLSPKAGKNANWRSKSLMDEADMARLMIRTDEPAEIFENESVSTEQAPETKQTFFRRSRFQEAM